MMCKEKLRLLHSTSLSLPLRKRSVTAIYSSNERPKIREKKRITDKFSVSLKPAPFFYYRDHSQDEDDDPLIPLTLPGKTANFPAKLHAILSNPELADIIEWMEHGRSWRILKPRQFEMRVLPKYFEHSKFSSFVRQTNGWGFRRLTQGPDRNCYYHEYFLRGLPHLCKKMKRHGVSEKFIISVDHEPDFKEISKLHPLPKSNIQQIEENCVVENMMKEGPKARMPVRYEILSQNVIDSLKENNYPVSSLLPLQAKSSEDTLPDTRASQHTKFESQLTDNVTSFKENTNQGINLVKPAVSNAFDSNEIHSIHVQLEKYHKKVLMAVQSASKDCSVRGNEITFHLNAALRHIDSAMEKVATKMVKNEVN